MSRCWPQATNGFSAHPRAHLVASAVKHLGAHVQRSPHLGVGLVRLRGEGTAQPQVAQLDAPIGGEENVSGLDISVHHARLVHVAHAVADLR